MEKFLMHIKYEVQNQSYQSNALHTPHFNMVSKAYKNHIYLEIQPKVPLKINSFSITIPKTFQNEDRLFLNGYQSWTDSREHFISDKATYLNPIVAPVIEHTSFSATGDYTFVNYDKRAGCFHGFSYGYIRNKEKVSLYASLNERSGYTIFRFLCPDHCIRIEKDLEGLLIQNSHPLLDIVELTGSMDEVFDQWFDLLKIQKPSAKRKNGYTTWYNYYPNINESIIEKDLNALSKVDAKIDIFQIDDGYQTNVGDWLRVDSNKFPSGMKEIAHQIHQKGMEAGLWLAPFAAQYLSKLAKEHPNWLIRDNQGTPIRCGINWGGFYALDIEYPEVRAYIRHVFDVVLKDWGYDLVKLDFLYAACMIPNHNKTRGQLMCEAMDFLRECVGDKQILGCGVPLFPAFGKVEYCRIGPDMDLRWNSPTFSHREIVCTQNAICNTIFRRELDKRAFLNDPDVFLLRENNMHCSMEQREIIARINKLFGSVLFTSDNVGTYNQTQMMLLKNTFLEENIQILSAEFSAKQKDVLSITYSINHVINHLDFHIKKGCFCS